MCRVARWSSFSPHLRHESEETNLRACAAWCEHLLPRQSDLASMSARVETSAPGVESRIQPRDCPGDEPCPCGIFLTFCIVPPTVAVVGFQGEGWKRRGRPARGGRALGKKAGWVTRTQGLVTRGDLASKRKASSGLLYVLSHAVEPGEQPEGPHRGLLLSPRVTRSLPQCPAGTSFIMKSPASLCCLAFVLAEFRLGHHSEASASLC